MSRPGAFRKIAWIVAACLAALGALLWLSRFRGRESLQQWKARMTARGERFGIDELAPPLARRDTNLDELIAAGDQLRGRSFNPADYLEFNFSAPGEARPKWLGTNLVGGYPRTTSTWAQVTAELESARPDLDAVRASLQRPADSSINNYHGPIARNFLQKRVAAQWLVCEALGRLHAGDLVSAQAAVLALARMARLHQDDLTIVNQMIRAAIGGLGFEVTWAALQSPGWTETQLAELQGEWERVAYIEKMPRMIEMERAQTLELFESARTNGLRQARTVTGGTPFRGSSRDLKAVFEQEFLDPVRRLAWAERDELFYLENTQRVLEAIRRARAEKSWLSVSGEMVATYDAMQARLSAFDSFLYPLSGMTMANYRRAWENIMRQETQRSLLISALALHRYQLRHGRFPPDLESLAPEFLAAVPLDFMNGQPLRYRLEPGGSFRLYSVGADGVDDGGNPAPVKAWKAYWTIWEGRDAVWPRMATPDAARSAPDAEVLQRVQFTDAPVSDVIETLAGYAGVRAQIDTALDLRSYPPVTRCLENITALGALEAILKSNWLVLVRQPGTNLVGITTR